MGFDAASLQQFLHQQIPLSGAMRIAVRQLETDYIQLGAPLAANHNDKGTAFGGSLASIMTLTGWSLLAHRLRATGIDAELVIQRQELAYARPVKTDITSSCRLSNRRWQVFVDTLRRRGRSRISLSANIDPIDQPAATMNAQYVALMRNHND